MNKFSDVASAMDSVLNSAEHKSLFQKDFKVATASDESCDEDHDHDQDCSLADSSTVEEDEDENDACDEEKELLETSAQYTVAVDSLLLASEALDNLGHDNGAALSLKLASLVVEAKKKDNEDFKAKMQALREKKKSDKDKQSAKDKLVKEKDKEKAAKEKEKEKAAKEKEKEKLAKEKEKAAKEKAAKEAKEKAAKK